MEHFGKLFGLAMSLAAAFSLLQFPVFVLIQGPLEGNPLLVGLVGCEVSSIFGFIFNYIDDEARLLPYSSQRYLLSYI